MIGRVLSIGEWSGVLTAIPAWGSVSDAMEMVLCLLDRVPGGEVPALLGSFPPSVEEHYFQDRLGPRSCCAINGAESMLTPRRLTGHLPGQTAVRSTITQIYEGTNQIQRMVMARQLLK
jgi:alkylation response protein AidB-like acyl-CoA dehydrogenase